MKKFRLRRCCANRYILKIHNKADLSGAATTVLSTLAIVAARNGWRRMSDASCSGRLQRFPAALPHAAGKRLF
jgi:hypothetical protein